MNRASVYLIYAALILLIYAGDKLLGRPKKSLKTLGLVISLLGDFGILGYGLYLYFVHGLDQAGFILGSILFIICLLCLFGRIWQNKEKAKREEQDRQEEQDHPKE